MMASLAHILGLFMLDLTRAIPELVQWAYGLVLS
jgi:hypothetical protein